MLPALCKTWILGLGLNLGLLGVLYLCPVSRANLPLPEGEHAGNLWRGQDVLTYVQPARNLLAHGVIGNAEVPDLHRSVGYPAWVALFLALFGSHWLLTLRLIQAALFAAIYPALFVLAHSLFPREQGLGRDTVLATILFCTYLPYAPMVLTDMSFALLFTVGLASVSLAVATASARAWFAHVISIGLAAQLRPCLGAYALLLLLLVPALARHHAVPFRAVRRPLLWSALVLLVLGNLPALRNYYHHGWFTPSDVVSANVFDYLALKVLEEEGKASRAEAMQQEVGAVEDPRVRGDRKTTLALAVFTAHPCATLREFVQKGISILLAGGIELLAPYFDLSWVEQHSLHHRHLRQHGAVTAWFLASALGHLLALVLLAGLVLGLLLRTEWLQAAAILGCYGLLVVPAFFAGGGARHKLMLEGPALLLALYALRRFARRGFADILLRNGDPAGGPG